MIIDVLRYIRYWFANPSFLYSLSAGQDNAQSGASQSQIFCISLANGARRAITVDPRHSHLNQTLITNAVRSSDLAFLGQSSKG